MRYREYSGRDCRLSPDWSDDGPSLVFDANSGDYWVVPSLALSVVKLVKAAGVCTSDEIFEALTNARDHVSKDVVGLVLDDLVSHRLLQSEG